MAEGQHYSSVIDDLPLMTNMYELPDETFTFETPGGRIVESTATTRSKKQKITEYYLKALPELGWNTRDDMMFIRENEALTIKVEAGDNGSVVHFSLTPESQRKKRK